MDKADAYKTLTRCDGGKLSKVIEYQSGHRVEIPINTDGTIKWFDDNKLLKNQQRLRGNESMMESPGQKESMQIKTQLQQRLTRAGMPADKINLAMSTFDEVSHDYIFVKN